MSLFDILEQRTGSDAQISSTREAFPQILSEINRRYFALLKRHANAFQRMTPVDKSAFERRLFTMAKRELSPYGGEFFQDTSQQKEFALFLEPLRIRSNRC